MKLTVQVHYISRKISFGGGIQPLYTKLLFENDIQSGLTLIGCLDNKRTEMTWTVKRQVVFFLSNLSCCKSRYPHKAPNSSRSLQKYFHRISWLTATFVKAETNIHFILYCQNNNLKMRTFYINQVKLNLTSRAIYRSFFKEQYIAPLFLYFFNFWTVLVLIFIQFLLFSYIRFVIKKQHFYLF